MPPNDASLLRDVIHESLWWWIGLAVTLAVLGWVIVRLRAWFHEDNDPADDTQQLLSEVRELYHEGDLSEQEYRSIKSRLTRQSGASPADSGD